MTDPANPQSAIHIPQSPQWPFWAIYLGVSWTWCIGMFLPVLLIRDYGLVSFFIFAIPNIIGAAAIGWVMRTAQASERFVVEHRIATAAFSWVTIAFQAFFIGWISSRFFITLTLPIAAFAGLFVVFALTMRLLRGADRGLALLAALASWFLFVIVARYRSELSLPLPRGGGAGLTDLAAIGSVCVLGFVLCPYLDRTFHHARAALDQRSARWAFGLGFGVVFASMLCFTLAYSDLIGLQRLRPAILFVIVAHLIVQSAYTSAAHAALSPNFSEIVAAACLFAALLIAGVFSGFQYDSMDGGEFVYRLFMSFYGLVAPSYVWLCVIPTRRAPVRWQCTVLGLAITAAAPFYWLAFIEREIRWAGAGVVIVLLARVLIRVDESRVSTTGR